MKYTCTIPCFDLEQTALSGQCFRLMPGKEPGLWSVISQGKLLSIRQNDSQFIFECEEGSLEYWLSYFDVSTDYQAMIDSIDPDDTYLLSAAKAGAGIRILRQDPWEMIITFVISQQKTIPAIRSLVEALCRNYGTHIERTLLASSKLSEAGPSPFAFPTPEQLSRASLDDLLAPTVEALSQATEEELRGCGLGYRAKYIHRLCQDALEGSLNLDLLSSQNYKEAIDYLTSFYGIGKKVANCVCLFGLHHIDAFPVDTWIQKILMEHYFDEKKSRRIPKSQLFDRIIEDSFGCYPGYAGVMQQYIFNYERNVIGKNQT